VDERKEKQVRDTASIDKTERNDWNAEANRRTKRWLISTLLLLVLAYFLPLRFAVLLALFFARLADPDLKLENLPFAFPLPLLFRPPRRNTIYATSVVLKDESSGDTRARLHILENGEPALCLYGGSGEETAVFTPKSEPYGARAEDESQQIQETLLHIESRIEALEDLNESAIDEVENAELEKLRNELSRLAERVEGNSRILGALSQDSRVLLEAVKRIDPSAIKTMEEISSYDDGAEERYSDHAKANRHWSDYEPSVQRLESEMLKVKDTQLEIQSRVARLEDR
jgi:hypothetical protein